MCRKGKALARERAVALLRPWFLSPAGQHQRMFEFVTYDRRGVPRVLAGRERAVADRDSLLEAVYREARRRGWDEKLPEG